MVIIQPIPSSAGRATPSRLAVDPQSILYPSNLSDPSDISPSAGRVKTHCLSVFVRACPCLSVSVRVRPCLSVFVRACPCLSVFVRACPCPPITFHLSPCNNRYRYRYRPRHRFFQNVELHLSLCPLPFHFVPFLSLSLQIQPWLCALCVKKIAAKLQQGFALFAYFVV